MKIAVLTANLGDFDAEVSNTTQRLQEGIEMTFHRFTDNNFPPIVGLTPRLQYRIPKMFGWQMFPGYDYYIWLDGSFSLQHPGSVEWFFQSIGHSDILLFKHPWRDTIKEEVDHIEEYLQKGDKYITPRYKNGLHKEQYAQILLHKFYKDNILYTSTAFMYANTPNVREALTNWWAHTSRYFTCDQIALPFIVDQAKLRVTVIEKNQYKIPYLTLTSKHK